MQYYEMDTEKIVPQKQQSKQHNFWEHERLQEEKHGNVFGKVLDEDLDDHCRKACAKGMFSIQMKYEHVKIR